MDDEEQDAVLIIVPDLVFGWYRLVAKRAGHVRISAEALGVEKHVELEVLP